MEQAASYTWLIPLLYTLVWNFYTWANMDEVENKQDYLHALSNVIKAQWGVMGSLVAWLIWALFV